MLKTVAATLLALSLSAQVSGQLKSSKFLWISDLHLNPMAVPGDADARITAELVNKLADADVKQWEAILEEKQPAWFSEYGSDTNWWLLKSALQDFPKKLQHPTFVMVTGDLLAHGFHDNFEKYAQKNDQKHYRAFVLKTVRFLALEMQRVFPDTKIFITPGNNDDDCSDYAIIPGGAFLHGTAPLARALAEGDKQFDRSWKALGSYSLPLPAAHKVRLVSFNSVVFSQKRIATNVRQGCKTPSPEDGSKLMKWLSDKLSEADKDDQKVWLMFHIPPGIDGYDTAQKNKPINAQGADGATTCGPITPMWVPQWTSQFDSLLGEYPSTVLAGFAAHIHSDDFRLIGPLGGNRKFVLLNPPISPIYGQNPGFRVVTYLRDGTVTDQTTYYLTNLICKTCAPNGNWIEEYTFTSSWNVDKLDAASLSKVYDQVVAEDGKARQQWLDDFAVLGPTEKDEKGFVRALYCADEGLSIEQYKACYCGAGAAH